MEIVFDTEKNTVKVGSKTFGVDMPIEKQNDIAEHIENIRLQAKILQKDGSTILENAKREVEQMIIEK